MNFFPVKLAQRYVFSGKNAIEVNVISWIAFLALGFVTACLVVVLSVFSGLEEINLQFYSNINPELKITPAKGKTFIVDSTLENFFNKLKEKGEIEAYSKIVEEKAYISYNQKSHIVSIKGVDEQFNHIFQLDSMVKIGESLNIDYPQDIIVGAGVSSRLSLFPNPDEPVELFVPKPGTGMITSQEDAFNGVEAYNSGIFFINDKYEQYVFSSLSLSQDLLQYKPNQISAIEIKSNYKDLQILKSEIQKEIGDAFVVKTRQELDAAFLKMMNTENLMIYLIFILILLIASFNLAGSVAIIILDKRKDSKTLVSLGMNNNQLRMAHFTTGMLITVYALVFGLVVGGGLAFAQKQVGLVSISEGIAFPVRFTWFNFLIITSSVLSIGIFVSWFVSRNVKFKN